MIVNYSSYIDQTQIVYMNTRTEYHGIGIIPSLQRRIGIQWEDRTSHIDEELRTSDISSEDRMLSIMAECRTAYVGAEDRTTYISAED